MTNLTALSAQADAAREAAERADAALRAARDDREQRERAARAEHSRWRHEVRTKELAKARDEADAAWGRALADPDISLDELHRAWLAMRIASHVHFTNAQLNASRADTDLGMAVYGPGEYMHGQGRPRPAPMHDYSAESTWAWAVEKHRELAAQAASQHEAATQDAAAEAAVAKATQA